MSRESEKGKLLGYCMNCSKSVYEEDILKQCIGLAPNYIKVMCPNVDCGKYQMLMDLR